MGRPPRTAEATAELRLRLAQHGERIVAAEGAEALTMRRLAAEAQCGLGLPYRVFKDRSELVVEIARLQIPRFASASQAAGALAGTATIVDNLRALVRLLLDIPALSLGREALENPQLLEFMQHELIDAGLAPTQTFERYVSAERDLGRIRPEVDTTAIAQLLAAALRDHVLSGRFAVAPDTRLARMIEGLAALL